LFYRWNDFFTNFPRRKTIYQTQALIHLENLRHNLGIIRKNLAPGVMICAAVKANAYGHGLLPIAQELKSLGVEYLAVANMDEARLLRKEGIAGPILCLGAARAKEITIGLENEAEFTISDKQALQELAAAAKPRKTPVKVHLKVDVGMGRLGCTPDQALDLAKSIHKVPDFDFQGLFTHFPLADNGRTDPTGSQLNQFLEIKDSILQAGIQPHIIHTANSGATFDFPPEPPEHGPTRYRPLRISPLG
jgi:alanine racemase